MPGVLTGMTGEATVIEGDRSLFYFLYRSTREAASHNTSAAVIDRLCKYSYKANYSVCLCNTRKY